LEDVGEVELDLVVAGSVRSGRRRRQVKHREQNEERWGRRFLMLVLRCFITASRGLWRSCVLSPLFEVYSFEHEPEAKDELKGAAGRVEHGFEHQRVVREEDADQR